MINQGLPWNKNKLKIAVYIDTKPASLKKAKANGEVSHVLPKISLDAEIGEK